VSSGDVILQIDQQTVVISTGAGSAISGEANTLADAGQNTHESLVASPAKVGLALQVRGLRAGSGVTLTPDGTDEVVEIAVASGGGHAPWFEDEFTPTPGQITFIATQPPTDTTSKEFYLNGVLQDDGVDYTQSGGTFTWIAPSVTLGPVDKVIIRYQ
jgi:hypothetical protein